MRYPENKIAPPPPLTSASAVNQLLNDFEVVKTSGGYLNSDEFLNFLAVSSSDSAEVNDSSILSEKSFIGVIIFILLGGLALNLTPCVLPMIPINLAIVGTQIFAAIMCGFGWLVPALPWTFIGVVWCYNIAWMFIQDIVKKITYQVIENRAKHQRHFLNRMTE